MADTSTSPLQEERSVYKPGSITRIKLQNFLTYAQVEFSPGPRLNVVIGPNGTGKSTILCAICLGLGGQPTLLGRADDARTFIMHKEQIATIEIELAPINGGIRHVFRRVIDRNKGAEGGRGAAASKYFVNDHELKVKEVQDLVKNTYNISIDNMCTFLPQDRVGSFSGFNSKMLLEETEKSLSSDKDLYEDHMKLIQCEEELLTKGTSVTTLRDKLKRQEEEHLRLKREQDLMVERKEAVDRLNLFEKKKLWSKFDVAREEAVRLREERGEAKTRLTEAQNEVAPLKESLNSISCEVQENHSRVQAHEDHCSQIRREIVDCHNRAERTEDNLESELGNLSQLESARRLAEQRVRELEEKLKQSEAQLAEYPPEEDINNGMTESKTKLKEIRKRVQHASRDVQHKIRETKDISSERQDLLRKYEQMKDDKARRTERIFNHDKNLAEVFKWVDQNRKMFRRRIWGPIICEITPQSDVAAAFLESSVGNAVFKSFVVECREDMNLLYREVREKLRKKINIQIVSQGILENTQRKFSPEKMEALKEHGVIGYLDETFQAPDAILQALRSATGVDTVLVGNDVTYESLERRNLMNYLSQKEDGSGGLRQVNIFCSDRDKLFKHGSTVSRYTGKLSIRIDEIPKARQLLPGVPEEVKTKVQRELQCVEDKATKLESVVAEARRTHDSFQAEGQECSERLKEANAAMNEINQMKNRMANDTRKMLLAKEDANKDNGREKKKILKSIKLHVSNKISYVEKASSKLDILVESCASFAGVKMMTNKLLDKQRTLDNQVKEHEANSLELKKKYNDANRLFSTKREECRQYQAQAMEVAPISDSDGNELPLKAQLDELPTDPREINDEIEELVEKLESITDNPGAIKRYEEQKLEMQQTQNELNNYDQAENIKKQELKALRDPWEKSLRDIAFQVNGLFSQYMGELGMAGEIRICKGSSGSSLPNETEEDVLGDFKNWGIEIRVKFREKSDLQVLSAQVHSGGERSVSTIMYLMALQDLMTSPFRCVDEINQGLDERNERLVFRRIVENSTKPPVDPRDLTSHCGQYFLITPKLLPNLTDMENEDVTILCIFNGKFNHMNWNTEQYIGYGMNEN